VTLHLKHERVFALHKVRDALQTGIERLASTPSPRRHTELLLEHVLRCTREQLYLRIDEPFSPDQAETFDLLLKQREAGTPVQYIVGWAPFYGLEMAVGKGVFIPRFDTEVMVERLLLDIRRDGHKKKRIRLLDLCCGTGAVGIAAAVELPEIEATLLDLSFVAIRHATLNSLKCGVADRCEVIQWDALEPFPPEWTSQFDYVTANPPYIPVIDLPSLHPDVRDGEPRDALTDEGDGLAFYRRWAETVPVLLKPGGRFYTEIGIGQGRDVRRILSNGFSEISSIDDLNGIERIITGIIPHNRDSLI